MKAKEEKLVELKMIEKQAQQIQNHLEGIEEKIAEMKKVKVGLIEFKECKPGSEMFTPIADGIFAKAKLVDNKEILLNVGAKIVVNKSVDDAIKMIEEQLVELDEYHGKIVVQLQELIGKAEGVQEEIKKLK